MHLHQHVGTVGRAIKYDILQSSWNVARGRQQRVGGVAQAAPERKVGCSWVHAVGRAGLSQAPRQALHQAGHVVLVCQQQAALQQRLWDTAAWSCDHSSSSNSSTGGSIEKQEGAARMISVDV